MPSLIYLIVSTVIYSLQPIWREALPFFAEALNRIRKRQPSFGGISVARPSLDRAARIAVGRAEFGQNSPFCAISVDKLDFIL